MVKDILKRLLWKGWRESGVLLTFGCSAPLIGILLLMHATGVRQMSISGCILSFNALLIFVYSYYTVASWNNGLFQNRIPLLTVYRYLFSYLLFLIIPILIAVSTGFMLIYWKRILSDNIYSFRILYLSESNIFLYLIVLALLCYLCVTYIYGLFFYKVFNNSFVKWLFPCFILILFIFFTESDINIIQLQQFLLITVIAVLILEISLKFNKVKNGINITFLVLLFMITIFPQLFRFTTGSFIKLFHTSAISNTSIKQDQVNSNNYKHHVKIEKNDNNNTINLSYFDDTTKNHKIHTFDNYVYVLSVADNDSGVLIEQINIAGFTSSLLRWQPQTDKLTLIAVKPIPKIDSNDEYFNHITVDANENYVILEYNSSSSAAHQCETWLVDMVNSKAKIIAIAPFHSIAQQKRWKKNRIDYYIYNQKITVTLPDMNVTTKILTLSDGEK